MNRVTILCLLGGLTAWMGMTADGCAIDPGGVLDNRKPPAILSTTPNEDTRVRSLEVDLRSYPETDRIAWDFGDGSVLSNLSTSTGRAVTHEFARDGTFVVAVHLFTAADVITHAPPELITSGSLPIDIVGPNSLPTAFFAVEDVFDDGGVSVLLTRRFVATRSRDPDGVIEKYRWDFGDGVEALGETVEHTFSRSGRFPVRLRVTDDRGAKAETTLSVLVNSLPAAAFTFTEDPNDPLRFTFDASGSSDSDGQIQSFAWDFGDESAQGSGLVVSHTYAAPDDFTVTLTVTDEFGASVSTSQTLDVTGIVPFVRSITPSFGASDTTVEDAVIDGENFEDGALVRLERGVDVIEATSVTFMSDTTLEATFDLTGAAAGSFDVVVENPDGVTATLVEGFSIDVPQRVRLTTSLGDMVFELVTDAPVTTANFLQYVEDGFYDGTIFHRVVPGFVVQGGGFLPGMIAQSGVRPPIVNEFSPDRSNLSATVAMAKLGNDPDSATSEFFVNLGDNSGNLDNQNGGFTVFARVVEGFDVAEAIAAVPLNGAVPVTDVILIQATRE